MYHIDCFPFVSCVPGLPDMQDFFMTGGLTMMGRASFTGYSFSFHSWNTKAIYTKNVENLSDTYKEKYKTGFVKIPIKIEAGFSGQGYK